MAAHIVDWTGQRVGRLTIIRQGERAKSRNVIWVCRCDCGNETKADSGQLRLGRSRSCGCLQKELLSARQTTHGFTKDPDTARAVKSLFNAIRRCEDPRDKRFKHYGGRGIKVCRRWRDPVKFIADMGPCPPGYSLERINVDRGYSPKNCTWIPMADQCNNKTTSRKNRK